MTDEGDAKVVGGFWQFARFGLVGVANTAIDFIITNILVLAFSAGTTLALFIISLIACGTATLNSFFLNRMWTFRASKEPLSASLIFRYYSIAFFAIIINTSVFLFFYQYLSEHYALPKIWSINISKLFGVMAASTASFIGFKLGVFDRKGLRDFRERFQFSSPADIGLMIPVLLVAACLVRLWFLTLTTAVVGDGGTYAEVARALSLGEFSSVDTFWISLFCYWEALLLLMGLPAVSAAILASFIPGVLLVVPIALLARMLYGNQVAWLAGWLSVVHPRLVEYSCNGYAEMLYLLALAIAVLYLVQALSQTSDFRTLVVSGMAFGASIAVRNEAMIIVFLCMLGVGYIFARQHGLFLFIRRILLPTMLGLVLILGSYVALCEYTLGVPGVLGKGNLLANRFSEQIDLHSAAQEIYGDSKDNFSDESPLWSRIRQTKSNVMYSLQRLPGVLITPTWLFAVLLPVLARPTPRIWKWPLVVLLVFPLIFYPLTRVEPRYLFAIIIPVQIFGAAGVFAFCSYVSSRRNGMAIYPWVLALLLSFSVVVVTYRGIDIEGSYRVHRETASWIREHISEGAVLIGDGYGNITTTAFLAGHPSLPRLWTTRPEELLAFIRKHQGNWLILYESYTQKANPELLPLFDHGVPGMILRFQTLDSRGKRVQIYERVHR